VYITVVSVVRDTDEVKLRRIVAVNDVGTVTNPSSVAIQNNEGQKMDFTILVIPYMVGRGENVRLAGSDTKRFRVLMERLREQMQFAESVGYTGFCMTEQHMQIEGIEPTTNPLFWDYFVAQHTQKMRVGQVGMNLTVVNPKQLRRRIVDGIA
jgi:hypothetical protein